MRDLKELGQEELLALLSELNQPGFRARQIKRWMLSGASSFSDMSNIPESLRSALSERFEWKSLSVARLQRSVDGTRKYLLELPDGNHIEAVLMSYDYGNTLCVSTQVGCNMGCSFCASTVGGKTRNLKAWEMLYEYLVCAANSGESINHVVLMGMGEPLDNYEEVAGFLRLLHNEDGPGLSYRNITLSTCGIVPRMGAFGDEFPQVNLAVSLHAAKQEEREALMPIAARYKLPELIEACRLHAEKTGRRVSFEYALIEGVNDGEDKAEALARLLRGLLCHVNLIALNPVDGTGLSGSTQKRAEAFRLMLEKRGINATIRRRLGQDIDAACGQLRKKYC